MTPPSPGLLVLIALLSQPFTDAYVCTARLRRRGVDPPSMAIPDSCGGAGSLRSDDASPPSMARHGIGLSYTLKEEIPHDRRRAPAALLTSDDPSPAPFTSWEDILRTKTRSGRELKSIPAFVDFCRRHEYLAMKVGGKEEEGTATGRAHIRNQLQGGRSAGPIATTRAGQSVRAGSYYSGLTARPRHSLTGTYRNDDLSWVNELQIRIPLIQEEFRRVLPIIPNGAWESLRTRRGTEWSNDTGWSHVAFVDNFRRRDDVVALFPTTARILDDIVGTERRIGPRLVAIARQKARTGIPMHYDYMNWMLTLHTGLAGPDEGCGIVVDGVARDWTVGDPVVMDTTFAHRTYNESDEDLYLLLVDFWHPDLSVDEIDALRTFFAANSCV